MRFDIIGFTFLVKSHGPADHRGPRRRERATTLAQDYSPPKRDSGWSGREGHDGTTVQESIHSLEAVMGLQNPLRMGPMFARERLQSLNAGDPLRAATSLPRSAMHRFATPVFTVLLSVSVLFAPAVGHARQAPSFSVKTVEGKPVRLAELRNRPVIVDFWATWCGPCRASMPHLSTMQTRYEKDGLAVIGMSVDEDGPAVVRQFAKKLGVKFTVAMANDEVLEAYGPIRSIPTTFFINRKGEIVRRVMGYIDPETMDDYVKEILQ